MIRTAAMDDFDTAIEALESDGYVVIEDAISEERAGELAELTLASPQRVPGVARYEFFVALLNFDLAFLELAMHPTVLRLARHLIGGRLEAAPNAFAWPAEDQVRLGTVDGLVAHPGSDAGWWHLDSPMGQLNPARPLPDFPILVNAFWVLTPYSTETGATRLVPGSGSRRHMPPATQNDMEDQVVCEARPGSVIIVPNTLWHAAGSNRSEEARIGVACNYIPWWVGRMTMDNIPVSRDVWEKMPPDAQALTRHQLTWNVDFIGDVREVD